jgi:maleylacetoacetate isomerase
MHDYTLYTYFRSSAAWRVRIALALKGQDYAAVPVHLVKEGGQQHATSYQAINPQELVPALVVDGTPLTQSLAICEYLNDVHPTPPLLPTDPLGRAKVRALALAIAADIHPINNLRVLQYLKRDMGQSQEVTDNWYRHWIELGFKALEAELAKTGANRFCFGDSVTLADICLVPQVFNARRFNVDLALYPHILAVDAHLMALPVFVDTQPAKQADAE